MRVQNTRGRVAGPSDLGQRETDRRIFGNADPTGTIASGGLGLLAADVATARQAAAYLSARYGGGHQ